MCLKNNLIFLCVRARWKSKRSSPEVLLSWSAACWQHGRRGDPSARSGGLAAGREVGKELRAICRNRCEAVQCLFEG